MRTQKSVTKKAIVSVLTLMFLSLVAFSLLPAEEALAASGLTIYTNYPGIAVKPGENIETDITVSSTTGAGMTVDLKVLRLPEGWEAFLEGGGRIVDQVYVGPYDGRVTLSVKIPQDAQEGKYEVVIGGSSGSASDRLTLVYTIKSDMDNKGTLTANYTELKGSSDTSFKYEVEIRNNKAEAQTYSLGADVNRGWQVKFSAKYDTKQIASIPIEPNKTATLEVEVIPPANINAGEYVIPIAASSLSETLTTDLKVIITGSYDMELTTPSGRLNAETTAGKEKALDVVIQNTGSSDLTGVKLRSWQPEGWEVRFDQDVVDAIPAGESATVKAYIKPDDKAIAGDYVVEVSANTPEVASSAQFRVMVKTSTLWGLVGVIVIILLIFGLYWTFNTYGRR